jgi:SAM-dependent MidA family methyltransferase
MGSSPATLRIASSAFVAAFRAVAGADGAMTFAQFMALALYHPQLGYYRRAQHRVGYGRGTDFFTATTSGAIFGELVAAACVQLLRGRDPRAHTFVEIGTEPGGRELKTDAAGTPAGNGRGIMSGVAHPFGDVRTIALGEPIALSGPCVVFSNELFDAQPFRRFVFRAGAWHELGVALRDSSLVEVMLPATSAALEIPQLPSSAPDGYIIDAPVAARDLAARIAAEPWTGLFVACDYGKSWRELAEAMPAGTARAYFRHTQSNDLLARPGEQDLTCHLCWDWLVEALSARGFVSPTVESQEGFFMHHAGELIARTVEAEAARLSQRKLALMQLLHPAHLGQKFQVLHALR